LGLGTGGVVYQTRVGAADPQKSERVVQERPRRTTEAKDKRQDDVAILREMLRKEQEQNNKLAKENAEWRARVTVAEMERQSVQTQNNRLEAQLQQMAKDMAARVKDQEERLA